VKTIGVIRDYRITRDPTCCRDTVMVELTVQIPLSEEAAYRLKAMGESGMSWGIEFSSEPSFPKAG
jgi:hypothetical protein